MLLEEQNDKKNGEHCDCDECKGGDGLSCCCAACAVTPQKKQTSGFWQKYGFDLIKIIISTLLLISSVVFNLSDVTRFILCAVAYVVSVYEIVINCVKCIARKIFLDENTLMFIASLTAFCLKNYSEGVLIVVLYSLGELLEEIATDNSRNKIAGLSELKVSVARVITENGFVEKSPEAIEIGSLLEIRKGDRVPIDGVLIGSVGEFDMKAITGESKPYFVESGKEVYSGSVNLGNSVIIKTTKLYSDSTVEKIIDMVEGANARKAKSQRFITSFAKVYTPIIVFAAIAVAFIPPLFDGMNFIKWIYKALSFLVISCPCALVISVPLAFFTGIGSLAKKGILVKGSNYVDALSKVKIAAFDKTGTLTKGEFSVEKVYANEDFGEEKLLSIAASLERKSNHPVSKAILDYYGNKQLAEVSDIAEQAGKGLSGIIDGDRVFVGNAALLADNGIKVYPEKYYGTVVFVAINKTLVGKIYVCDIVKKDAEEAISGLEKVGVTETVMISGDNRCVCDIVGKKTGIDTVYSELLPEQKVEKIKLLKNKKKGCVLYAGDGINDAPSIALSDVGVAMGALGSEIAIESADVVIMDDDVNKITFAIKKAKKVRRKVVENIVGSLAIKAAIMAISLFVGLPVWVAMLGDVGVMLLAVVNSLTAR